MQNSLSSDIELKTKLNHKSSKFDFRFQNKNLPNARLNGVRCKSPKSYQNGSLVKADLADFDFGFNRLLKLLYGANPGRKISFPFEKTSAKVEKIKLME